VATVGKLSDQATAAAREAPEQAGLELSFTAVKNRADTSVCYAASATRSLIPDLAVQILGMVDQPVL
jgi:hypothetical protein